MSDVEDVFGEEIMAGEKKWGQRAANSKGRAKVLHPVWATATNHIDKQVKYSKHMSCEACGTRRYLEYLPALSDSGSVHNMNVLYAATLDSAFTEIGLSVLRLIIEEVDYEKG